MFIAKTIAEIRSQLEAQGGRKIAFVPTMGALHDGHLALVKKASELAEIVVVSIYVNKAQFNDPRDYENYPRQVELDLQKLKNSAATHVFIPQDFEISSVDFAPKALPDYLLDCLCGKARPGHFEGVAMIVSKLFRIVKPQLVVLGQKDFQQVLIIKKLIEDFNFEIEIFAHEIVREKSGLAMSSRNQNLSKEAKIKAASIFHILSEIKNEIKNNDKNIAEILQKKCQELLDNGFEKIDYLEIRDEKNLQLISEFRACLKTTQGETPLPASLSGSFSQLQDENFCERITPSDKNSSSESAKNSSEIKAGSFKTGSNQKIPARIFIAVYLTGVRLIDNMAL